MRQFQTAEKLKFFPRKGRLRGNSLKADIAKN